MNALTITIVAKYGSVMRNLVFGLGCIAIALFGAAEPPSDHIVVLVNDRVLEGDVIRNGDTLTIRRGQSETSIPASQALFVGPDLKSAYQFLRSKTDLKRAEERLRLAKWCHEHGLQSDAVTEIDAALEIKPGWLPALVQRQQIKQGGTKPRETPAPTVAVDCSPEAIKLFGTKVQPILMNACVSCHSSMHCGTFELRRINTNGPINQTDSQFNLAKAIRQVDRKNPAKSPLLIKATTAHGGMASPAIKDTNAPTFKHLEQWIKLLTTND
jgi:hypothetical protein